MRRRDRAERKLQTQGVLGGEAEYTGMPSAWAVALVQPAGSCLWVVWAGPAIHTAHLFRQGWGLGKGCAAILSLAPDPTLLCRASG